MGNYSNLFDECDRCFYNPPPPKSSFSASCEEESDDLLEVQACGSYLCSIAAGLHDLRRIDPSVFEVSADIDKLLEKHYGEDFGFVICKLTDAGKQHPLGYFTELRSDFFVPTRHDHGDGEEDPEWDHKIYSFGCEKAAGELRLEPTFEPPSSDEEDDNGNQPPAPIEKKSWRNVVSRLLDRVKISVKNADEFRRMVIFGPEPNKDLFFSYNELKDVKVKSKLTNKGAIVASENNLDQSLACGYGKQSKKTCIIS